MNRFYETKKKKEWDDTHFIRTILYYQSDNLAHLAGGTKNILPLMPMSQVQVDTYDITNVISRVGGFSKVITALVTLIVTSVLYYFFWDELAKYFIAKEQGV